MDRVAAMDGGRTGTRLPTRGEQMRLFAREFLKHPKMLGSVVPSSRRMTAKLLAPVNWDRARLFVEYGPGIGNISVELLRRMHPDARLVLFELNSEFATFLKTRVRDPRLIVLNRSAADVETLLAEHGLGKADVIVSGIPFSTMPEGVAEAIADATEAALKPGGQFLVYQFSPKVEDYLTGRFSRIDTGFEALNVPPARLYVATK
jgi:phospholipid N-methyltransferase